MKRRWPGREIAAFDVLALLLGRHVARLMAERALGRHHRLHGEPLDHRAGDRVFGKAVRLRLGVARLGRAPSGARRDHQRGALQHRRQGRNLALAVEFRLAPVQPFDEARAVASAFWALMRCSLPARSSSRSRAARASQ